MRFSFCFIGSDAFLYCDLIIRLDFELFLCFGIIIRLAACFFLDTLVHPVFSGVCVALSLVFCVLSTVLLYL